MGSASPLARRRKREPVMPFAAPPPIASDPPCGPDLDLAFDEQYMGFMASAESWLPSKPTSEAYYKFEDDVRKNIDFAAIFADIDTLSARTQDIRLCVIAAKFTILNRDIRGFARWVNTIAGLMSERWEEANPRGEGGDFTLREVALATLDEDSSVLVPLQYAPLIESPRLGALTYRAQRAACRRRRCARKNRAQCAHRADRGTGRRKIHPQPDNRPHPARRRDRNDRRGSRDSFRVDRSHQRDPVDHHGEDGLRQGGRAAKAAGSGDRDDGVFARGAGAPRPVAGAACRRAAVGRGGSSRGAAAAAHPRRVRPSPASPTSTPRSALRSAISRRRSRPALPCC